MAKMKILISCLVALCTLRALAAENTVVVNRAFAAASKVERENWRKTIAATPRPATGCFQARYPETKWRAVPCDYSPRKLRLPNGGGIRLETVGGSNGDMTAQVPGGITQSEGSFDSVSTTGESDSIVGAGKYSLQLNTEFFNTSLCTGAGANCKGWAQFIFDDDGSTSIQYWMIKIGAPGASCPTPHHTGTCAPNSVYTDGWCPFTISGFGYCAVNSPVAHASAVSPTALASVVLQGNAHVGTVSESATAFVSGIATTAPGGNYFPDLGSNWHEAEFNVFGHGNSSVANFDPNTTLVARVGVDSGVSVGPGCDLRSFTAETNNLSIINTTSTPAHNGHPSLIFTESNTGTPNPSCSAGVSIGDTHLQTFNGLFYDFQASGDFILAEVDSGFNVPLGEVSKTRATALPATPFNRQARQSFIVQTRQVSGAPTWPDATVNKAVAVRAGNTRVALCLAPTPLKVDGVPTALDEGNALSLPGGVSVARKGNSYFIASQDGDSVRAQINSSSTGTSWIDVSVGVGHWPNQVRGLLANVGGNVNQIQARDGVLLTSPFSFADLYGHYADSWRVPAKESLLSACEEKEIEFGIPARSFYAQDLDPKVYERTRAICKASGIKAGPLLDACTLDVAVIGDDAAAKVFVNLRAPILEVRPIATTPGNSGPGLIQWLMLLIVIALILWILLIQRAKKTP